MDGTDRLPPPSPELSLIGALVRAHLATLPKKKRQAFLRAVSEAFREFDEHHALIRIRPADEDPLVREARTLAANWWRHALGAQLTLDAMSEK